MRATRFSVSAAAVVVAAGLSAACGGSPPAPPPTEKVVPQQVGEMSPEEAGGMRAEDSTLKEAAGPASPHGGTLVKLGTAGQLEFVHDPSSGLLTAYVLDAAGHVTTRIPAKAITVEATPAGGKAVSVALTSTANGLTGDTVGNSSQFGGTAASLRGVTAFAGVVKDATVAGQSFKDVAFSYPAAK